MTGAEGTWSFAEEDFRRLQQLLERFRDETRARYVLLADRAGQLLTAVGDGVGVDSTSFASLAAADFEASNQLAHLLGEDDFASLWHQGEEEGMFLVDVGGRAILAALFGAGSTLGLLRVKSRDVGPRIIELFADSASRERPSGFNLEPGWLAEAEDEIDRLFGE